MDSKQHLAETLDHIDNVKYFIDVLCAELVDRSFKHDETKLENPEKEHFIKYVPLLKDSTYGSKEYKKFLEGLKPALDHHYAHTRHHPESFKNGISSMNLIDIVEMYCDWMAATKRDVDGNIYKSIEINTDRFGMSEELTSIFKNTANFFEEHK